MSDISADGAAVPASAGPANASLTDWIAVVAGALGALIASLDISIVNSALPQIQGEIGASGTEGTWIGTGYLVSEVVMIPLSAWLSRVLGLRTLLLVCGGLFTVFSVICGLAHDLPTLIIGRVGQGFFGGALIPTAQTIVRTRLPQHQMPVGMTLFGLIVLLGPLLGPLIGGWMTDSASWRWCFFINLPVAAALFTLLLLGLPHQKGRLDQLIKADWLGIVGLTLGLSCLTIVLEEGQRDRWFESSSIVMLSVVSLAGFVMLGVAQATSRNPVIKLRLLLNRSYASVILLVVVTGMVLYGILYVLPQFLSQVAGYNASQAGRILAVSGVPAILMMPLLPLILGKAPLRPTILLGLFCFATSCFVDINLTADTSGDQFVLSQLLRGLGQILAMMPLNQASVGSVSREDTADAAGLFNMARNLGGSLGLALLGVFIDRRVAAHAGILSQSVTQNSDLAQSRLAAQAAQFAANQGGDLQTGQTQALLSLYRSIEQQALIITYSECFWVLGVALVVLSPLVFILRPPPKLGARSSEIGH
jgi:DHA2 family multidrug resistance protein